MSRGAPGSPVTLGKERREKRIKDGREDRNGEGERLSGGVMARSHDAGHLS